ncbi:Beta-lactamase-related domain and Beta-lactamase/transpeptidase-like domain-containing protein [Strongyloides ratti]|uniref:Beta-lactamase-related domain and Beta-lactamase/transpeptidase-like domain-containing protein n=1 Tax=Strongyloides ratti TaxID=34506 RepID=A0A090MNJ4_STRRB|nr:Beta-lactamase-related domain and Beta-lactamase/transpeptidase-like domain-containing protein [Strongyloides ratti]CEF59636.1 Beta-lactamase-related domain and Beta-lactamase/transpeptidase-like domain-containing protein [Strongyloides ratti]
MFLKSNDIFIDGKCNETFKIVQDQFKINFQKGWESEGASIAVFHKGECVVDIYGGYADKSCNKKWTSDTLSVVFSVTKSIASICLAILIDRGYVFYDDLVTKYWPEFGKNGKENITIEMILNHRSGLVHMGRVMTIDEIYDRNLLRKSIEDMKPIFIPNTKTAYHTLLFGWIIDMLVEKIDPLNRSISQILKEEYCKKYNLDIFIGILPEYFYRLTRIKKFKINNAISETINDWRIGKLGYYYYKPTSLMKECLRDLYSIGKDFRMFNNPQILTLEFPSAGGVGNAYSIAKLHDIAFNRDEINSLSINIKRKIFKIPDKHFDYTTGESLRKGYGFNYTKSIKNTWQIGHQGVGGQNIKVDWENDLVICYLTNGMKAGVGEHVRTLKVLEKAIYKCI